ncbi:apolipoprotein D-like isoform X2 [Neocloeon triangulifer]|uniref:apolipoprotein D-like isoform X2 n=1 Tax=Neocloeon triangulifer TaxID=2078957 RepID=UPI00286EDB1C|nr:apolipoprotein D-like isoform X2 [Neocloeon triangulifer]
MWSTMCLLLSVVLMSATVSEAQVLMNGATCPTLVKFMSFFDTNDFTGTWYEMIRTKRWVGTEIGCVTHSLQMNSQFNISYVTQTYSPTLKKVMTEMGDAEIALEKYDGSSKGIVVFDIVEYGTMSELVLLDTDYTSFAVLWSCSPTDEDLHFENTMIWTRDKVPKASALTRGLRALDSNNLSRNYLSYTSHRNCPEFAPLGPDQGWGIIATNMPGNGSNDMPVNGMVNMSVNGSTNMPGIVTTIMPVVTTPPVASSSATLMSPSISSSSNTKNLVASTPAVPVTSATKASNQISNSSKTN